MEPPRIEGVTWDCATVVWDEDPSISPGAPITGFSMKWKPENGSWRRELYHAPVTHVKLSHGLVPDVKHIVSLTAHNSSGPSPEVFAFFVPQALPPIAPSPPTLLTADQESIEVHWGRPRTRGAAVEIVLGVRLRGSFLTGVAN